MNKKFRYCVLISSLLAGAMPAGVSAQEPSAPEALIRKLHADHQPWRAAPNTKTLDFHDKRVAARYIDADLVALFQKNVECRAKEKIPSCIMPVDPVFHLQDFPDVDSIALDIKKASAAPPVETYEVNIRWKGREGPARYTYTMRKTANGWRVSDIRSDNFSLKEQMKTSLRDMSYL
jgi:hypothetical protein